jgi:hypothetical protein
MQRKVACGREAISTAWRHVRTAVCGDGDRDCLRCDVHGFLGAYDANHHDAHDRSVNYSDPNHHSALDVLLPSARTDVRL